MRKFWQDAPLLTAAMVLALLVAGFFAVQLVLNAIYWNDPRHQDMDIAPWMTPRFVAMSWGVPVPVVRSALDLPPPDGKPQPLQRIAQERGIAVEDLAQDLEAAILQYREGRGDE